MTNHSLFFKKIFCISLFLAVFSLSISFAEPVKIACVDDPDFVINKCDVCYTEEYPAEKTATGWSSILTDVSIPWVHDDDADDAELIYDTEQKYPEVKGKLQVTLSADAPKDVWKYDDTLVWMPFDGHREFVLGTTEDVLLYSLREDQSITLSGSESDDHFLIVTPLAFRGFNIDTNTQTAPKNRNICIRGTLTLSSEGTTDQPSTITTAVTTTPTTTPATDDTTPLDTDTSSTDTSLDTPAPITTVTPPVTNPPSLELNSAGPETSVATTITAEQTLQKTGPEVWILLLLAFTFASAWHAWQRSQSR